jgi:K319L-like, PKD domain
MYRKASFIVVALIVVFLFGCGGGGGSSSKGASQSTSPTNPTNPSEPPNPPANVAPVANAGTVQTVTVGGSATLDGTGSSDPDGNYPLTYAWQMLSKPADSQATLLDPASVNPSFAVDKVGDYTIQLVVTDSLGLASPSAVVVVSAVNPTNQAPVAHAGPDQSVHAGSVVTLDGSESTDPNANYPLTYAWAITSKPAGSMAKLNDPSVVCPWFTADKSGDYVIRLIVTDSQSDPSEPDEVLVSTWNAPPVAEAGPDQAVLLTGSTVTLDGSQSYDANGDSIMYQWTLVSKPVGSNATLTGAATVGPSFVADAYGTYVIELAVADPWVQSSVDTVTVSFENVRPVANAGTGGSAVVDQSVTLDGTGSSDSNGDSLTYQWAFTSVPQGSQAAINDPSWEVTSFVPDLPGLYVVQLIVNDGTASSDPSTIQVQVTSDQMAVVAVVHDAEIAVASLDPGAFEKVNRQNTLISKLNAVIANIEAGNYAAALHQLENDIMAALRMGHLIRMTG